MSETKNTVTINIPEDVERATLHGYVSILEAADARPLGPYKLITVGQAIEMARAYQRDKRNYQPGFQMYAESKLCKWEEFFERNQP